jgi:hypothetical protein
MMSSSVVSEILVSAELASSTSILLDEQLLQQLGSPGYAQRGTNASQIQAKLDQRDRDWRGHRCNHEVSAQQSRRRRDVGDNSAEESLSRISSSNRATRIAPIRAMVTRRVPSVIVDYPGGPAALAPARHDGQPETIEGGLKALCKRAPRRDVGEVEPKVDERERNMGREADEDDLGAQQPGCADRFKNLSRDGRVQSGDA